MQAGNATSRSHQPGHKSVFGEFGRQLFEPIEEVLYVGLGGAIAAGLASYPDHDVTLGTHCLAESNAPSKECTGNDLTCKVRRQSRCWPDGSDDQEYTASR